MEQSGFHISKNGIDGQGLAKPKLFTGICALPKFTRWRWRAAKAKLPATATSGENRPAYGPLGAGQIHCARRIYRRLRVVGQ